MPDATENSVNALMVQYLSSQQIPVFPFASEIKAGYGIPDFIVKGNLTLYGEGEWNSTYANGLVQAANYGDAPQADGYFLIGYPEILRKRVARDWRQTPTDLVALLGGVSYRGVLKVPGEPARPWKGRLEEIAQWLRDGIQRKPQPPDPDEFLSTVQDLVENLAAVLPLGGKWPLLFEHAEVTLPPESGNTEFQRRAAAYLLLDQIVFYRILQERGYPELKEAAIDRPMDLQRNFFAQVTKDNYHAIYDLDVLSQIPESATGEIRKLVRVINILQPEQFTRDLLGNIFHRLIPEPVRKPVAAFYTNVAAARLLAKLSIDSPSAKVADLACGSGTLLMAAYDRKAELLGHKVDAPTHKRFVERDLTGVDIMSFAAHLAVVQLALRNPEHFTDTARIAVENSTRLRQGTHIPPLEETLVGKRTLDTWIPGAAPIRKIRRGSVSSQGRGRGFDMDAVDVVLMNPPFSRKQKISTEQRRRMNRNLSEYSDFIDNGMNLGPYFILLADRFLKRGGRMAMVLPDSVLDQESAAKVRKFLAGHYEIEYLIQAGHRLAFSEDASFLEILLVARKKKVDPGAHCVVAFIGTKPTESNAQTLADLLQRFPNSPHSEVDVVAGAENHFALVPQRAFSSSSNWIEVIPHAHLTGFVLPESQVLASLRTVATRVTQGLRFARSEGIWIPENTYLSVPRAANVRSRWVVTSESQSHVEAVSKDSGQSIRIPRGSLRSGTRSAAGMPTLELTRSWDYTVVGRFPSDEGFWGEAAADSIVERRIQKYADKETYLIVAGRNNVNLRSKNTHFLAFVSPEPTSPPWQFWCVMTSTLEEAKILGMWWNSTIHLAQLFLSRSRGMASYGGWEKSDLLDLSVLDPKRLSPEGRLLLLDVYEQWARKPFPSIGEQLSQPFEGRIEIDKAVCRALGTEFSSAGFPRLYGTLSERIAGIGRQEAGR